MKVIVKNFSRGYNTHADRKRAIAQLIKRGFNYFVCYHDTQSRYALIWRTAAWVKDGQVYIDR